LKGDFKLTKIVSKSPRIIPNYNLTGHAGYQFAYDFEHAQIEWFDNSFVEPYLPSFGFEIQLKVVISLSYLFIDQIVN
jgi:hypothetical protein